MKKPMYKKKSTYRKRGTKSKTSIAALKRDIQVLKKKTAIVTEKDSYLVSEGIDVIGPYVARNLCNYSGWTKMWPSTGNAISLSRANMYHRYFTIDNMVTLDNLNNEEGLINFTYFIVSRKDAAGSATDTVNSLSITGGVDYTSTFNGKVFMNLHKWKVHYCKRFSLTGGDGADMQADLSQIRFSAKVKVGAKIEGVDQNWNSLANSPDPSDTYYAILFSDNSSADLENPRWTFSCLHQIDN